MEVEHEPLKALASRTHSDSMFFTRIGACLADIKSACDVAVIDCPSQLAGLSHLVRALCRHSSPHYSGRPDAQCEVHVVISACGRPLA
jgi:hypothetical protein